MKKKTHLIGLLALIILLIVGLVIWNQTQKTMENVDESQGTITIGSKDFTENLIVAEIYALALEANGYTVIRKPNISSALIHNALLNSEIDLYPEYTGTGLLAILKEDLQTDPDQVYQIVKDQYQEKFKLTWLDYSKANDSQGLVIKTDVAQKLSIRTISDLQKHVDQLRFASQGEFDLREDGIAGLEKVYGPFEWQSSKVYDNSLKYTILDNDEADVTPAYTTEGQLVNTDKYTLLEDDRSFWPPYNLAPVIHTSLLDDHEDLARILNEVSQALNTEVITGLNAEVDVHGQEYTAVAKEFFESMD